MMRIQKTNCYVSSTVMRNVVVYLLKVNGGVMKFNELQSKVYIMMALNGMFGGHYQMFTNSIPWLETNGIIMVRGAFVYLLR